MLEMLPKTRKGGIRGEKRHWNRRRMLKRRTQTVPEPERKVLRLRRMRRRREGL